MKKNDYECIALRTVNKNMNIMNKQTIITCLRGTIGRWLKGKAIVIPVLVLVAMEGQAQNKFTIHGNFEK